MASVRITEVGPRDGLQNQSEQIATDIKVAFIDALSCTGVSEIEVSSFVNPKRVPQLADAADVFAKIDRREGVVYSALVPNERGLDDALASQVGKIAVFTAASESFSERNTGATIAQTLDRFRPVVKRARAMSLPVRGYISCVVECPYEGRVDPSRVADVARALLDLGVSEIDLGETIGVAGPVDIERLYEGLDGVVSPGETTLHLHDTRGTALACAVRALQLGVQSLDASAGGLGGCPFAPGAAGNLATEDLVYMLNRDGVHTGVDLEAVMGASRRLGSALDAPLPSRVLQALNPCPPEE